MRRTPLIQDRTTIPLLLFSLILIGMLAGRPAAAVVVDVPITNPGFEADPLRVGGIRTTITGWRTSPGGGDGIFRPTLSDYPGGVPEGHNVAYVNLTGNSVRQTLSTPLDPNTTYVLSVAVGWNNNDPFAGYLVQLRAGGTVLAEDRSSLHPAQGTWVTSTVRYTSGDAEPELGAPLEIRLLSPGVQANYDDVRLTAEASEPISCPDLTVATDEGRCSAAIDPGVYDPSGRVTIIAADPSGPYPLGNTLVTFTIEQAGARRACTATVTVVDRAAPLVECNAPETITLRQVPISFTATASDNCQVASVEVANATCQLIGLNGNVVELPWRACRVSLEGDTLTVPRAPGVRRRITWEATATDGAGNSITRSCETTVLRKTRGYRRR